MARGVGRYRSMLSEGDEVRALAASRPPVPVLAVGRGRRSVHRADLAQAISGEVTSVQLKGVDHYTAPEAPQALSAVILDFVDGIDAIVESGS